MKALLSSLIAGLVVAMLFGFSLLAQQESSLEKGKTDDLEHITDDNCWVSGAATI